MRENIYFYFMHTHVLLLFSLVFLLFNTTTATSFGQQLVGAAGRVVPKCIDKERQALLDFKAHITQDPKNLLFTWRPEEDDCCQWRGVVCDNVTGHVKELLLESYGLEGEISHSLINLICSMTHLTYLGLGYNQFSGSIPKSIGNMTQLTYLDLGYNQFTGTIPDSIRSLTKLTTLVLAGNQFTGTIPISIGSLTKLTYLDLSVNSFYGTIPISIGNMTQLTYLYLDGNNFSGVIPRSVGSLTKLIDLYLSNNPFYGPIPSEFGNLTNLEFLYLTSLRSCTVENLDWLSSNLKYLLMDGTSLAKANNWVNVIIGLQNLSTLSLNGCDLSHVMHPYSSSVNSSSSLERLYLDNNNLNSSMHHWLSPLTGNKLTQLYLSGNKFDGELSDFLNSLSGCTSATLSDVIQHFSSLERLNLSSNQFDGTISDKLWQLPSLEVIDLSSNSLRGAISKNIGKSNLWYIDLSNNSLEGVPLIADVSNLSQSMQYLDFSSNKVGPRFPKWIQKLKNLIHLDLSKNSISDTVSKEYQNQWQSYHQLEYLDLSFNNISGAILNVPSTLLVLDLSKNKLSGKISFLCQIVDGVGILV